MDNSVHTDNLSLRDSDRRYRELVDNALIGIYQTSLDGTILYANEALARTFEFTTPAEMMRVNIASLYRHPEHRKAFLDAVTHYGKLNNYELKMVTRTGRPLSVLISASLEGNILAGMVMDITERKEMLDLLYEAKVQWEDTFNIINDAITIHDREFNIIRANRAAEELLGFSLPEILNRKCFESYHGRLSPPEGCPSCKALSTGTPSVTEIFEPHLGRHLEIKALPRLDHQKRIIGLVHIVRDITLQKKTEEERQWLHTQFIQAQKMESIGRLAGGIAHDFNNILSAILGYGDLALLKLAPDADVRPFVDHIREAALKAASLTHQLLAFSRKQVLKMSPLDLGMVVEDMAKMLRRVIGEDVALRLKVTHSVRRVLADQGQIEQVLMNLAVNARDAMPSGGSLSIGTEDVVLEESEPASHEVIPPGPYVRLLVSDTGEGISREVQKRIFEPFFTTKELGKGTGLGLATVYGIVKQHQGFIRVQSEKGQGAAFEIFLPASGEDEDITAEPLPEFSSKGNETILIVEDEPSIGGVLKECLTPLGYTVLEARDGAQALAICDTHPGTIHLLLSDVIMPGMDGGILSRMIMARRPGIKVILMSGYTEDVRAVNQAVKEGAAFVQKPIVPAVMAAKIREVLDL